MIVPDYLKRASVTSALFYCLQIFTPALANANKTTCQLDKADETVVIKHIHDGDTLWLEDGRKLRVIGLNTPELARDDRPAEPLAERARDQLQQLLGNRATVQLRHGREKFDRYGRLLAHVYSQRGTNLSEWLLRQGLAFSLSVPPNLWHADCYLAAEQSARQRQKGLWSHRYYRLLEADRLSDDTRGFQIIRGTLRRIGHSKKTVWLNFNRQFAVRILRKDLVWFRDMNFEQLKGKQLEVRGWVQYHKGQLRMRVKHPAAIHILP